MNTTTETIANFEFYIFMQVSPTIYWHNDANGLTKWTTSQIQYPNGNNDL